VREITQAENGFFVFQDLPSRITKFKSTFHYLLRMSLLVLTLLNNFKMKATVSQQQAFGLVACCIYNMHTDTLFVVGYKTYPMITYSKKGGVYMDTRLQ